MQKNTTLHTTVFVAAIALLLFVVLVSLLRVTSEKPSDNLYTDTTQDVLTIDYDYEEIAPRVVRRVMRKTPSAVTFVDIRTPAQFSQRRIAGSINIPYNKLVRENSAPAYNTDLVVIVFDHMNAQSLSTAAKILSENNRRVAVLSGGLNAWEKSGAPILTKADDNDITALSRVTFYSLDELQKLTENGSDDPIPTIIVDIRPAARYAEGHIPTAINVSYADLERHSDAISATKKIVVYGQTARDSFYGALRLLDLNFPYVFALDGGYIDWIRAEYRVER